MRSWYNNSHCMNTYCMLGLHIVLVLCVKAKFSYFNTIGYYNLR